MARGQQRKINYIEAKQILTTYQFHNLMIIQKSLYQYVIAGKKYKFIHAPIPTLSLES